MGQGTNIFSIVTTKYKSVFSQDAYTAPGIPEKKMNGAIKGIANNEVTPGKVLLVYDSTLFGGAGDGILVSKDTLYYKTLGGNNHSVRFDAIVDALYDRIVSVDKNGKETVKESVIIIADNGEWRISKETGLQMEELAEWLLLLRDATAESDSEAEQKVEQRALEDMPLDVRLAYVKVIINFLLEGDNNIDEKEFSQLYSLIARLSLSAEDRFGLLLYQASPDPTEDLVENMRDPLDDLARQQIIFSLAKDLIYIQMQTKGEGLSYEQSPLILGFVTKYGISHEQMVEIKKVIDNDQKIFDDDADDSVLEDGFRNVASNAAAVGVPLAALYFSGSVIGLGATGITSGLATLGLGGIFGLSGMVSGIGAIILIGIGAKKGIEHLTGQGEIDKRKRKEALLLAVNKHLQKSINILMEDINNFTRRLSKELDNVEKLDTAMHEYKQKLQHLVKQLQKLSGSGTCLVRNSNNTELAALRQGLPHQLNVERLVAVTDEPTTKPYYDSVLHFYEEKEVTDEKDVTSTIYSLRSDLNKEEALYLSEVLSRLEYFSTSTLAKQGLQSLGKLFSSK